MKTVYMNQVYMGVVGDIKNLEQHYSHMAEKGWMIDNIGIFTHRYRAIKPCKKNFFVDILPQITAFDYPENEDAQDYRSFCEASGWTFVAASKQFQVFCAEDNTLIPIHTDNAIQAKIHLRTSRKYELPLLIYALVMMYFFSPLSRGVELFFSNMMLFMTIGYAFFSVGFLWTLGFVIRWQIRARRSAKRNLSMPVVNYRLAKLRNNVFVAGLILFLLCSLVGVILDVATGLHPYMIMVTVLPLLGLVTGLWIRKQIDTKKRTRRGNIRLTIVALVIMEMIILVGMGFVLRGLINIQLYPGSIGDLPTLTLQDFGINDVPEKNSAIIKGSIAVPANYSYWEVTHGGSVNTDTYRSVSSVLSQMIYKHFAEDFNEEYEKRRSYGSYDGIEITNLSSAEAAIWGAEEGMAVFSGHTMELLLHRGKTILRLSIGIEGVSVEEAGGVVRRLWSN